ncbi:MAG: dihydroneopterin aldolase [Bdellovibrionaceae bacterium]|nr:dihydroneopterin aldolase [Pseudobdellovibrionaceae bacterium]
MHQSKMKIKNYEVWVSLGCTKEEQSLSQPVLFNIDILFTSKVLAEDTDQLQDSLDYVALTDIIKAAAEKKSYHMVEHLGSSVAEALKNKINVQYSGSTLVVRTHKLRAPVKNLHNGVEWSCKLTL